MKMDNLSTRVRVAIFTLVGLVIGGFIGSVIAGPVLQWRLFRNLSDLSPVRLLEIYPLADFENQLIALALIAGFGLLLGAIGLILAFRGPSTQYGDARFATVADLRRTKFAARLTSKGHSDDEIIWGKFGRPKAARCHYFKSKVFPHGMLLAPTGAGKGVSFVIPNLLHFNGSTVTLDVKGENFEKTSRFRASIADRVYRFSPLEPENSHFYNPLAVLKTYDDPNRRYVEAQRIASYLLSSKSSGMDSFFETAQQLFCAGVMLAFKRNQLTLGDVRSLLSDSRQEVLEAYAGEVGHRQSAETFNMVAAFDTKVRGIYVSVLNDAGLGLWGNPFVAKTTSRSDFDFTDLRRDPASIYLVVGANDLKVIGPLARLFFQQLIGTLQRREPGPDEGFRVLIMLDEFDSLGRADAIAESFKTLRSFGGRLVVITQSIGALEHIYKTETPSLIANAGVKSFMATDDPNAQKYISELVGDYTRVSKSSSHNPLKTFRLGSSNVSEREESARLIRPEQVARLPEHQAVVLRTGQFPTLVDKIVYYEDSFFKPRFESQSGKLPVRQVSEEERIEKLVVAQVEQKVSAAMVKLSPADTDTSAIDDLIAEIRTEINVLSEQVRKERAGESAEQSLSTSTPTDTKETTANNAENSDRIHEQVVNDAVDFLEALNGALDDDNLPRPDDAAQEDLFDKDTNAGSNNTKS